MAEVRHEQRTGANSFVWPMPSMLPGNPLLAIATDANGKLLESVASAQKDWTEFVHRRVKQDIAVSQQRERCRVATAVEL